MKNKAIFIDRDGTINADEKGYINSPADFEIYSFAYEAMQLVKDEFWLFVATNQSGIARGYLDENDLEIIHKKMQNLLPQIDDIFYCPYHIEGKIEKFAKSSDCRKPKIGMINQALSKYDFRKNRSFVIGDKITDIEFGKNAGLTTILVLTGNGERIFYQNRRNWKVKPDYVVENLLVAMKLIKKINESALK